MTFLLKYYITGTSATVMSLAALTNGQGCEMPPLPNAISGGSEVNTWAQIMDLVSPTASDALDRPIIDADGVLTAGGAFFENWTYPT
jgi:hypothetical protein